MQSLLVYSSRTGNTRKIAEAVFGLLPEPRAIRPVENAPDPAPYEFIVIGFWVRNGAPDEKSQAFAQEIKGKKVCLFGTMGGYPDSGHAKNAMKKMEALLADNEIIGGFMCQGKADESSPEWLKHIPAEKEDHAPRHQSPLSAGKTRPDEKDIMNAKIAFTAMLQKLKR